MSTYMNGCTDGHNVDYGRRTLHICGDLICHASQHTRNDHHTTVITRQYTVLSSPKRLQQLAFTY